MARQKHRFRSPETGVKLLFLGSGLLLAPVLVQASDPVLGAATQALRTPGWISVAAGTLILGLHFLPGHQARRRRRHTRIAIWEQAHREQVLPALSQGRTARDSAMALPTEWGPRVFELIEWHRFEAVCATLFAQAGFQIHRHVHSAEGSVDMWLHTSDTDQPVAAVQCKHWKRRPIPVARMRAFLGTMAAHEVTRGTFATSSTFSPEALALGRAHGINLLDGAGLIRLIQTRTPEQQAALLALALEGDFWKPSCPSCDVKLTEQAMQNTRGRFWGCPNYPACRFVLPVTEAEAVFLADTRAREAQGAQQPPEAPPTPPPAPRPGRC